MDNILCNVYEIYKEYDLTCEDNKGNLYLGTKEKRTCRFCGLSKPEVTFEKKAHTVSELLGNKRVFSYYECDKCNKLFSKYEYDTAELLKSYRAVFGIEGKKGPIKPGAGIEFKNDSETNNFHIRMNEIGLKNSINSFDLAINNIDKTAKICSKIKYNPMHIYKHFLKMALSIMPDEDISSFDEYLGKGSVLLDEESSINKTPYFLYTFILSKQIAKPKAKLYRKNSTPDASFLPEFLFTLDFSHYIFCFYILGKDDKIVDKDKGFRYLPKPDNCSGTILDLSENVIISKNQVMVADCKNINLSLL